MKINEIKEGEVYWSNNSVYPKGHIWKFNGNKSKNFVNTIAAICDNLEVFEINNGLNDAHWENLRLATQEEIDWLNACINVNKFVPRDSVNVKKSKDRIVHCKTQEEWDFACDKFEKGEYVKKDFLKNGFDTFRLPSFNGWNKLDWYKTETVLSFQEWCNENNYKPKDLSNCIIHCKTQDEFDFVREKYNEKITQNSQIKDYGDCILYIENNKYIGFDRIRSLEGRIAYSFQEWCNENGYKMKEEYISSNCTDFYKVGDYVIVKGYCSEHDGKVLKINKIDGKFCYFDVFHICKDKTSDENFSTSMIKRLATHEEVEKAIGKSVSVLDKWLEETKSKNLTLTELIKKLDNCDFDKIYCKLEGEYATGKAQILFDLWNKDKFQFEVGKWYSFHWKHNNSTVICKVSFVNDEAINICWRKYLKDGDINTSDGYFLKDMDNIRELSIEEIQQYLPDGHPDKVLPKVNEFVLPDEWYIKVTKENQDALSKWRYQDSSNKSAKLSIGNVVGINKFFSASGSKEHNYEPGKYFKNEITFEQFNKYVLGNKEEPTDRVSDSKPSINMVEIQKEAKRRFPIGCVYSDIGEYLFNTTLKLDSSTYIIHGNSIYAHDAGGLLYDNGEWAELISLPTEIKQTNENKMYDWEIIKRNTKCPYNEGDLISCTMKGTYIPKAMIHYKNGKIYLLQDYYDGDTVSNKFGFKYSWSIVNSSCYGWESGVEYYNIKNIHVFTNHTTELNSSEFISEEELLYSEDCKKPYNKERVPEVGDWVVITKSDINWSPSMDIFVGKYYKIKSTNGYDRVDYKFESNDSINSYQWKFDQGHFGFVDSSLILNYPTGIDETKNDSFLLDVKVKPIKSHKSIDLNFKNKGNFFTKLEVPKINK